MNKGTPVRAVRVDDDLWRRLEDRAAGSGLSSSEYLRRLIAKDAGVNRSTMPRNTGPSRGSGVPRQSVRDVFRVADRYVDLHRAAQKRRRVW